ncbi:hypothetical protein ACFV3E_05965 [Streptomyces sp. NPDC059718]
MTRPTISLNDLIKNRLEEIAEDAWINDRVMNLNHGDGRLIHIGTATTWELWQCHADHGNGRPCGEALITAMQAATLLGDYGDDGPVPHPVIPAVEIELLDEAVGGFLPDLLYHRSDVEARFKAVHA